jgi:uncharacterized FlaG/YvyC family protein
MSISSVSALGTLEANQSADTNPRPQQPASNAPPAQETVELDVAATQQQAAEQSTKIHSAGALTQDEVQVQRDAQISEQIIIKYLDQNTGNLILQVPSDQVLNVAHGIHQEFEQQLKTEENVVTTPGTGESSGH